MIGNIGSAVKIQTELLPVNSNPTSIDDVEALAVNQIRMQIQQWIAKSETKSPGKITRCRDCGRDANFTSLRAGYVQTQFGLIRYKRAHYLCPHCHNDTYPLDERLNPVESLARMRTKLASGKSLPVAELAKAWGLGSLNPFPAINLSNSEIFHSENRQSGSESGSKASQNNSEPLHSLFWQHNLFGLLP